MQALSSLMRDNKSIIQKSRSAQWINDTEK